MASPSSAVISKELILPYLKAINDNKAQHDESLKKCNTEFREALEKLTQEYPLVNPSLPLNHTATSADVINQSQAHSEKRQILENDWSKKTAAIDKQFKEKQTFLMIQIKGMKQQVEPKNL